jgi:hypothetical protein
MYVFHVCIQLHTYLHECICIYMMHINIYTYDTYIYIHTYVYIHRYIYICIHTFMYIYIYLHVSIHVYVHLCEYIHICIYASTHISSTFWFHVSCFIFLYDNFIVYKIRIMYTCDPVMKFSLCDVLVWLW